MKFSAIFVSAAALAVSAIAEPVSLPKRHSTRDVAAVQSAVAQIQTGIQTLTKSVAAFNGDSIQVEADASALAATIEISIQSITNSTDINVADLASLTSCITGLTDAGKDLIAKLTVKKSQFEQAGLCTTIEKLMADISDQSVSMIKAVAGLLPEALQSAVETVGQSVTNLIAEGTAAFSTNNCTDNPAANTSKSMVPYPTGTATFSAIEQYPTTRTSTMLVTVTSCAEGQASTQTSVSIVKPTSTFTPSYLPSTPASEYETTQLITAGPAPTFSATSYPVISPIASTTRPASTVSSIPIAAGPRNAVGSAGLVIAAAAVVAAMLI